MFSLALFVPYFNHIQMLNARSKSKHPSQRNRVYTSLQMQSLQIAFFKKFSSCPTQPTTPTQPPPHIRFPCSPRPIPTVVPLYIHISPVPPVPSITSCPTPIAFSLSHTYIFSVPPSRSLIPRFPCPNPIMFPPVPVSWFSLFHQKWPLATLWLTSELSQSEHAHKHASFQNKQSVNKARGRVVYENNSEALWGCADRI